MSLDFALRGRVVAGGRCDTMVCDVAAAAGIGSFVAYAATRVDRLDGFVNNVGVSFHRPATDDTPEETSMLFELNLLPVFRGCVAADGRLPSDLPGERRGALPHRPVIVGACSRHACVLT